MSTERNAICPAASRSSPIPAARRSSRSTCIRATSPTRPIVRVRRRAPARSSNRSIASTTRRASLGVPVIHVKTVLRKGGVDDVKGIKSAWRLTFPLYVGDIPNADEHAIEGSRWTELVTRVDPADLVVESKKRLSVFYPTDLDFLLRNMNVRTVVLDGGFTDCCVLNAAFDASNLNYRVVVLRDLVRGTNPDMEDAALKMVSLHLGLVMDAADLLAEWKRSPALAPRRRMSPRRFQSSQEGIRRR